MNVLFSKYKIDLVVVVFSFWVTQSINGSIGFMIFQILFSRKREKSVKTRKNPRTMRPRSNVVRRGGRQGRLTRRTGERAVVAGREMGKGARRARGIAREIPAGRRRDNILSITSNNQEKKIY